MIGRVIKGIGGFYFVHDGEKAVMGKARGNLKRNKELIYVGDIVDFDIDENDCDNECVINRVVERRNFMTRPPVSNLDMLVVVFSVKEPDVNYPVIDKLLAGCEIKGISPVVCITKIDLLSAEDLEEAEHIYRGIYPVVTVNGITGEGIEDLRELIRGRSVALAGPSGVGKSTLTNMLHAEPGQDDIEASNGSDDPAASRISDDLPGSLISDGLPGSRISDGLPSSRISDDPVASRISDDPVASRISDVTASGRATATGGRQPAEIGTVSDRTGRGRHTTRHVEIFALDDGTYLYDTPGFTSLDVPETDVRAVRDLFPEMRKPGAECRYRDCLHINEPDCAVKAALESGKINKSRYNSYIMMTEEVKKWKKL